MSAIVTPLIWTVVVALVLSPRLAGRRLGFGAYLLTMAPNELPLLLAAVLTATMVTSDRPDGAVGAAWWALWTFVLGGLVWAHVRAVRAAGALDGALEAALGAGWRHGLSLGPAGRPRRVRAWLAGVFLPFQRRWRRVERIRGVPYGPDPAHRLDVYRAPGVVGQRPILLHFHEGGFVQGGRSREGVALLHLLAAAGWLCLSVDYRLRERGAFPHPLVDAKRAIAWVRAHAAEHGADPAEVYLIGGSAGGHLAVGAALTADDPRFQPGFERADTSVAAAVSLYGYLGPRSADPASAPASLAGPASPPLMLVDAAHDTALPQGGPAAWAAQLRVASGAPVVRAVLPGAQHAFDLFASVRARLVADAVADFLAWVRATRGTTADEGPPLV